MRFGFELVEAIRAVWPEDRPLFARLSCQDGKGGHWDLDDTLQFAQGLKARGVDLIDCSSGGINGPLTLAAVPRLPGYHVPFAEAVRREVGIVTMGPGLITEARQAEAILQQGAIRFDLYGPRIDVESELAGACRTNTGCARLFRHVARWLRVVAQTT